MRYFLMFVMYRLKKKKHTDRTRVWIRIHPFRKIRIRIRPERCIESKNINLLLSMSIVKKKLEEKGEIFNVLLSQLFSKNKY